MLQLLFQNLILLMLISIEHTVVESRVGGHSAKRKSRGSPITFINFPTFLCVSFFIFTFGFSGIYLTVCCFFSAVPTLNRVVQISLRKLTKEEIEGRAWTITSPSTVGSTSFVKQEEELAEASVKNEETDDDASSSSDEDYEEKPVRSKSNKSQKYKYVGLKMKEEDGRFRCMTGDCPERKRSFRNLGHLREHYLEDHQSDADKPFHCNFCQKRFGCKGILTKHTRLCKKNEKNIHDKVNKGEDKLFRKYPGMKVKKENGRHFCLNCADDDKVRSFLHFNHLREHFMQDHLR